MYYTSDPWMQAAPEIYEVGDEIIATDAAGHLQHYANPFGGSPIAYTLDPGTVTTAPTSGRRSHNYHQHLQMQLQRQHQAQHHNPQQTYFASEQPPQLWASPRSSSDDDSSSTSSASPPQSPKLILRERERKLSYQPASIGMYSRSNRSPTAARASVGGRPRNFTTGGGAEMRQQFAPLRSWVPEDQHHRHNPAPVAKTPTKGASPKVGRSPKAGRSPRAGAASKKSSKEVKQFLEAPLRPGTNLISKGQFAEVPMMLCDRSPTAQDASPTSSLAHIGAFRRANAERGPGLPTAPYPPSPFIVPTTHLPPKPSGGAW